MKNLSIKTRLIIIAGVSVLLLLVVGVTGWMGVAKVGEALSEVGLRNDALRSLSAIRLAQLNVVMKVREGVAWDVLQYEPESDKRQFLDDARAYYTTLDRRLAEDMKVAEAAFEDYSKIPKGGEEERQWQKLQQQWQGFKSASETASAIVADLAVAQDWSRLKELAQSLEGQESLNQPMIAAFERDLNELLTKTRDASSRAEEAGVEAKNTIEMLMLYMFMAAIVILAMLSAKVIRDVVGSLEYLRKIIVSVAEDNDFRIRVALTGGGEIVETANAFDLLIVRCRDLLMDIASSASRLSDAARDTAAASERLSCGSVYNKEAAATIGGAVKQVTEGLGGISESARQALERAKGSGEVAIEGAAVISCTSNEMDQIVSLVSDAGQAINQVDSQFCHISLITNVIKDVADRTSLLSLNAAIEAARAGESGRGFAVVADEVRNLAERTAKSTDEIGRMISLVQESSRLAVDKMQKVIERVDGGKELASRAADRICTIRDFANEVRLEVEAISGALEEQNSFADRIRNQIETVEATTAESCVAARQTADVSSELQLLAEGFQHSIGRFKI